MPRSARRCIRCAGVVTFYLMAVFSLEYVIILGHMQYLVDEKGIQEPESPDLHIPKSAPTLRSGMALSPSAKIDLEYVRNSSRSLSSNSSQLSLSRADQPVQDDHHNITKPQIQNQTVPKQPEPQQKPEPVKPLSDQERKRIAQEAELEKTYYRLKPSRVNPYKYDYVVTPKNLCDKNTTMLILVHSYHSYEDRRRAIRETWGSVAKGGSWPRRELKGSVKLAFVLGRHKDPGLDELPREEAEIHNDIIQGSFIDAYANMTLKSLLGLRYFVQHCHHAKVLLKSDDDMVINIPWLLDVLDNKPMSRSIMGPLNKGARVYRTGKWKLPKEVFPFKYYPPYESGAAYVIAGDLVGELFEASEYVPSIFIDDVYITGILGKILNVSHVHQLGFAYWVDRTPTSCDINEDKKMTGTKMKPDILLKLWDDLKKDVRNCPTPPPRRPLKKPTVVQPVTHRPVPAKVVKH